MVPVGKYQKNGREKHARGSGTCPRLSGAFLLLLLNTPCDLHFQSYLVRSFLLLSKRGSLAVDGGLSIHVHRAPGWQLCPRRCNLLPDPGAAAAWAGTGSKESCLLRGKNKGFLNLSVLKLASALRAPCSLVQEHLSSALGFAFPRAVHGQLGARHKLEMDRMCLSWWAHLLSVRTPAQDGCGPLVRPAGTRRVPPGPASSCCATQQQLNFCFISVLHLFEQIKRALVC